MKHIFTREQAIAIIYQAKNGITDINIMLKVDKKNSLYKLTNDNLLQTLCQFMNEEEIAGIVD